MSECDGVFVGDRVRRDTMRRDTIVSNVRQGKVAVSGDASNDTPDGL